jgi:hypothetical protein
VLTFTQSTVSSPSVIWTSLKRLMHVLQQTITPLLPILAVIAFMNRIMLYIIYPEGIGKWVISIADIHMDHYSTKTQLLLTMPAIFQYPLGATCVYYMHSLIQSDKAISIREALWDTGMRLHIVLITFIIYLVSVALGCVLFIFPGIYLLGIFSMAIPGVMIDKLGVYKSFTESKRRTKGSVMYTLTLLGLAAIIPNTFFAVVGPILSLYIPNAIINEIAILISFMVNSAVMIATVTFAYIELGLRLQENDARAALEEQIMAAKTAE